MPVDRTSVEALTNMIAEVETLVSTTTPMPENRSARCLELLRAAKALSADLDDEEPVDAFAAALQTAAKWRREAQNDPVEFNKRDARVLALEQLATDIFGPLPTRRARRAQ